MLTSILPGLQRYQTTPHTLNLLSEEKKRTSQQYNSSISNYRLPLYPTCPCTTQEHATISNLTGFAHPLQRRRIDHPFHCPRVTHGSRHGRINQSRTNTVDPNLVFGVVNGIVARQGYDGSFRSTVDGCSASVPYQRSQIHRTGKSRNKLTILRHPNNPQPTTQINNTASLLSSLSLRIMTRQRFLPHHNLQIRSIRHPSPSIIDPIHFIKILETRLRGIRRRMVCIDAVHTSAIDCIVEPTEGLEIHGGF